MAAARITLGAAIAAGISHAAGWHYPAWAAIGAVTVMPGGHLHLTMNRSLQRIAGTVLGACIVWAIQSQKHRKSVVSGKSASVRVQLGGRRIITQKRRYIGVHQ